jgi:hypothetical protein
MTGRADLEEPEMPRVELRTESQPVKGISLYQAIPEMVEFTRLGPVSPTVSTLGLGRAAIILDGETGELVGLRCFVKTGRWRTGEAEAPPQPDAEGRLIVTRSGGEEDVTFIPSEPRFLWHEESRSLRISFRGDMALVFKIADSLMAGVDRRGRLTDIWMLDLDLSL